MNRINRIRVNPSIIPSATQYADIINTTDDSWVVEQALVTHLQDVIHRPQGHGVTFIIQQKN